MHVAHTVCILFEHRHIVLAAIGKVTRVKQQAEQLGVGIFHHTVNFRRRLHNRTHMMMEAKLNAHILCDLAEFIQSRAKQIPFTVIHHVFVTKNRFIRPLDGVTLLGHADHFCTHFF